ncbi:MAG TPA: hypothetical protein VGW75_15420 [Solirubrobacteraceae bacterium]|nr:hypothetical protein [Solirubrobacteraceae bacterium]
MAAYSLVLVLVLGGGGDGEERSVGVVQRGKARAMTADERRIARLLEGAGVASVQEATDVQRFRRPHVRTVTCSDGCRTLDVVYSVGLPGRGRILVDQRRMWERLFSRTEVVRGTMTVTRDVTVAGVPPKRGEETPTGAPLLTTKCDRSRRPNVDWGSARGAQILYNICRVTGYDQGEVHRQEAVAPDDETAGELEPGG